MSERKSVSFCFFQHADRSVDGVWLLPGATLFLLLLNYGDTQQPNGRRLLSARVQRNATRFNTSPFVWEEQSICQHRLDDHLSLLFGLVHDRRDRRWHVVPDSTATRATSCRLAKCRKLLRSNCHLCPASTSRREHSRAFANGSNTSVFATSVCTARRRLLSLIVASSRRTATSFGPTESNLGRSHCTPHANPPSHQSQQQYS